KWLFTSVFAVGVFLAALGGALQIPRDAVHHAMDLRIIVEVFVVVVIGGLGSIVGAFVAAVLVSELNAFGILIFPKISIILVFLVMAVVLMPPTLIASIYGMNFKMMPELEWAHGYPMALLMMLAAAIVPYWIFKWKKWL
ncbi:CorA family divalent cation transporter, partial [Pseudomonas sp. EL_65y_Pfl2_R96]|uniref:CorA family divalent cation transporter n=1 Tax=Pseudomonas sp. EL_65y_Pfl2_R96 TaxID=3088699 RepID=UPI0030DDDC4E